MMAQLLCVCVRVCVCVCLYLFVIMYKCIITLYLGIFACCPKVKVFVNTFKASY